MASFLINLVNLIISAKSFLLIVFEKNAGHQILFHKYETSKFFAWYAPRVYSRAINASATAIFIRKYWWILAVLHQRLLEGKVGKNPLFCVLSQWAITLRNSSTFKMFVTMDRKKLLILFLRIIMGLSWCLDSWWSSWSRDRLWFMTRLRA